MKIILEILKIKINKKQSYLWSEGSNLIDSENKLTASE